ncbi:hypothetical protein AKJ18_32055, partial [Vibrio xuii]
GIPEPKWAHEDISAMNDYDWPGNIRELKNLMERCILLGKPPAHYWREINGDAPQQNISVTVSSGCEVLDLPQGNDPQQGYP